MRGMGIFPAIHPEDHPVVRQQLERVLAGAAASCELRIITRRGDLCWLHQQLHPMWDETAGRVVRVYAIGRDITAAKQYTAVMEQAQAELERRVQERTAKLQAANSALEIEIAERKRAEAAVRDLNRELEQHMRLKDQFLANMSHELRTPLGVILTLAESLVDHLYGEITLAQREVLSRIYQNGRHLLSLISDILDITKIESGTLELESETVNVQELCRYSLQTVQEAAQEKRIALYNHADFGVQMVAADELRLLQILINLLTNAVKFTPEGGEVGIEVSGDRTTDQVHFTVWDTGIGIAAADQAKLFQPFIQLDGGLTRRNEGAGLGLALVARLAELHGGHVTLASTVGKGSRFTVTLPWRQASAQPAPHLTAPAAPAVAAIPAAATTPPIILLVEDNPHTRESFAFFLNRCAYQVLPAQSGSEALTLLQDTQPDLILMDVQMADLDGLEVVRRLREQARFVHTPVIALTALAMTGDRERCLAAGFTDYLSKPVELRHLRQVIETHLQ
jgi:signal transduction histidine kinase